jgi:hypothetical protein
MKKYNELIHVIYENVNTGDRYAVDIPDVVELDKYYSEMDKFLYAPDDLFVDCYPISSNPKNGLINFDYEHKMKINVKVLRKTGLLIRK